MLKTETVVGVPFYETEGTECLDATLRNVDDSLTNFDMTAPIYVIVNGPETMLGRPPRLEIDQDQYTNQVEIITHGIPGQVSAINKFVADMQDAGVQRVFVTDADIYRFPHAMQRLWEHTGTALVGAHYATYPVEIAQLAFPDMTPRERLMYQIFEGDKSPAAIEALQRNGIWRPRRVKGSLMLADTNFAAGMHGGQDIISDSAINRAAAGGGAAIAEGAFFMHWGRTDPTDHIKARLRHYRGALARSDIPGFLANQVQILPHEADAVAKTIRSEGNYQAAMLFLMRCALRKQVHEACLNIIDGHEPAVRPASVSYEPDCAVDYCDAEVAAAGLLSRVPWEEVQGYSTVAAPTTQSELPRGPIDLGQYINDKYFGGLIRSALDIKHEIEL